MSDPEGQACFIAHDAGIYRERMGGMACLGVRPRQVTGIFKPRSDLPSFTEVWAA